MRGFKRRWPVQGAEKAGACPVQPRTLYFELLGILRALGREIKGADFAFANRAPLHPWQHPRNTAAVSCGSQELGWLCALHPAVQGQIDKKAAVVCAQLDMDAFAALPAPDAVYQEPSRFPGIDIDLSLQLPEGVTFGGMESAWAQIDPTLLTGVALIDSFQQGAMKSLTLRFAFSSQEKTLSKEEVQPWVDGIVEKLAQMGVALRG